MEEIGVILPESLKRRWTQYVGLWKSQRRNEAESQLEGFLDRFVSLEPDVRQTFAHECCKHAFEGDDSFPFSAPILKMILLPHLADGLQHRAMPHLRWLVEAGRKGFANLIADVVGSYEPIKWLEFALATTPRDERAWQLLAGFHVSLLDFASHEMPFGWAENTDEVTCALKTLERMILNRPDLVSDETRGFARNHRRLVDAWTEYEKEVYAESFSNWCQERGFVWQRSTRGELPVW